MSQQPMFICVTGIDGTGKTTHTYQILNHLRNKGIKSEYKWMRFYHLLSLPLLAFCRILKYTRVSTLGGTQKCSYHDFYKSRIISYVYPWVLFADTLLFTTIKVYIPMIFGTSIVCDRFVYDTLIDVAVATKNHEIYKEPVGKLFLKLIPKNAKFIMLTIDKSIIFLRRNELKDDLTFDERYELYMSFASAFGISVVDNRRSVEDVKNSIISMIGV